MVARGDRLLNTRFTPEREYRLALDPVTVENIRAHINTLTQRMTNAENKLELKVDADNVIAAIILTDEDVLIKGDKISLLGEVTFADWHRDVTGQITGNIEPSLTIIRGGVIQTEQIRSINWTTTTGSEIDLDNGTIKLGGSVSPSFSVDTNGIMTCQGATVNGTLTADTVVAGGRSLGDIDTAATGYTNTTAEAFLENAATNIEMASSSLFSKTSGSGGVFIGSAGIYGKNSTTGATTFAIDGTTGAATFAGTLSAANGTFTGSLSGATGTFSGTLSAASGTFTGNLTSGGNVDVTGYVKATGSVAVTGGSACIVGITSSASVFGAYFSNTGGGTALAAAGNTVLNGDARIDGVLRVGGNTELRNTAPYIFTGTYSLGTSSLYWDNVHSEAVTLHASNNTNTLTTSGMVSVHSTHNLSASNYYGGSVPTNGTAPFMYFNVGGKVVLYIDSTGTAVSV